MVLSSVAMLSYNQDVDDLLANVFHADRQPNYSPFTVLAANTFEAEVDAEITKLMTKANSDLTLKLSHAADQHFAEPSSTDNEIMTLEFRANKDAKLYDLRLHLVGTESSNVGRVTLIDGEKIVAVGQRDGEYFDFNRINMKLKAGESKSLSLTVSLGSALKPSDRFRMDIDSAEDINIKVEGRSYEINYSFPMKGAYMTVSKNRQWGPYKSKKDK